MDSESQWISQGSLQSADHVLANDSPVHHPDHPEAHCILCRRIFLQDNEENEGSEAMCICRECKGMFFNDLEATVQDSHPRRLRRGRSRYRSSESIEDLFSQQFSHLINLVRQNQNTITASIPEPDTQPDGDAALAVLHRSASHTPQSRSRRWWRAPLSDNESEGVDNLDSLFGESDSNISFGGYGPFTGESDGFSFSAYGGESDASVDAHSLLEREMFMQADDGSSRDSDTDIDPMHVGMDRWNLDDEDEDGVWEEADAEEDAADSTRADGQIRDNNITGFTVAVQPPLSQTPTGSPLSLSLNATLAVQLAFSLNPYQCRSLSFNPYHHAVQTSLSLLQSLPPQVGTTRPPPPLFLPRPCKDLKVIGLRASTAEIQRTYLLEVKSSQ